MLIPLLFYVLVIACWTYALIFGGRTARWAFLPFLCMWTGTLFATAVGQSFGNPTMHGWEKLNLPLLVSDLIYFVGITIVALVSRRYWPIWSAGFLLLTVVAHFGPLLDPNSNAKIYRGLETVWALPTLLTMVVGIAKDRKAGLDDRPGPSPRPGRWRPWGRPSDDS